MSPPHHPQTRPDAGEPAGPLRARIALEVASAYAFVTFAASALYRVPRLESWFHIAVAGLFLYLPVWLLRRHDLDDYGLTAAPVGRNLVLALLVTLLLFPPFFVGFALFEKLACALPALRSLAPVPCHPGSLFAYFSLRLPPGLLDLHPARNLFLAELVAVALPEEFFFRGYVQGRLAELWRPRWQLFGAPVGFALPVSSALFALCHVAVQGNPATLAVFFPGLVFGWMRERSGSILPGMAFHALCNVFIELLNRSFSG